MSTASAISVRPSSARSAVALAGWVAVTFAAAAMGGLFLPGDWYARLQKPAWNPPNWIFGPVWSVLYTTKAIAAWLVWKRGGFATQGVALAFFSHQLLLNALWSPLFFGLHLPGWPSWTWRCSGWLCWRRSPLSGRPTPLPGRCCCPIWPGSLLRARLTLPYGDSIADHENPFPAC